MLCAISGEAPLQPVASRKSGNVFERRLIEAYISENGSDPVNGEELSSDDLIDLKQSRAVKPRPPTLTSIPALLSTFQNEWDAIILETFQLKQQLSETRQELSTALYYNDSAQRVIARLQKERDEARDALGRVTVNASTNGHAGSNGDAMQVDGQGLPDGIIAKIDETQQRLSGTRRKRPVPADWATGDEVQSYDIKSTIDSQFTGAKALAVDESGDFFICGDSDGAVAIYDLKANAFTTRSNLASGAITDGTWCNDRAAVSTTSGAVVLTQDGAVQAKFQQHAGAANAVAAHPCGDILASVGRDKSYVLYDLSSSKVLTQIYGDSELTTAAFHPDGHLFAAGTADGSIKLYDVKTSELAHTFPAPSASSPVVGLSFSENGTWLASANQSESTVTVWDLRKLNVLKTLDVGTPIKSVTWDWTGQFLAACGPGGVVVNQYTKSSKTWTEPLRKAINAVDVKWAANAKGLVALTSDGAHAAVFYFCTLTPAHNGAGSRSSFPLTTTLDPRGVMASDGTRGAGMNSVFQEHSNKRSYSTMADGRRFPDDSAGDDHASSSLFIPEDDHYDNDHTSRRPRIALPPLRHAGDGMDYRRPVTSSRTPAVRASNVIDLTVERGSQRSGQSMAVTAESSRAQRTPRFERDILNPHGSGHNHVEDVSRSTHRESHNLGPQVQSILHRQRMDRADNHDMDDIEVVLVRRRSRPRIMSRRQSPLSESTRSNTPRTAGADNPIDLTGDDDVVITDSRLREGGVNTARPGITAGLGTRSLADNAIATTVAAIFRHNGGQEGGRLWSYISRHGAREHQDLRSNTLGGDLLFAGPARVRHLPGRMDFAAVGFDMGLPEGNRPPSPKYEPPASPGAGFTRNPGEDEIVVCPSCGDELAMSDADVKQQVWVNKSCGHAYCGECAQSRGKSFSKKGKNKATDITPMSLKKCIVMNCGKPVSKNGMIQVYLGS
ncbi:cell cycle control protein, protein [Acrodontium crateriforme]|uniref:Pre-mRNA-processing factor 19 n=1 Tax=Acrodontium crateriforme TaxID=150365 RepID=A0AAQ3R8V4_9PEZI|nr:cell cycle control protein, protein [Acrodontium crateriforme]